MRFSIVVAAYNVERYIGECLESLKCQSFGDFECIVVNDCSQDGTLDAIGRAIAGDDRFTVLTLERNSGLSAARNAGTAAAAGEFVMFLDGDDYYAPDALERLDARITADNLDMLYFGAASFYESRKLRREHYENQEVRESVEGVHRGPDMYVLMERTKAFRPSACLYTVRKALLDDCGLRFLDGILHEDVLFQMQLIPHPQRVAFLNEPLYQRRMREGSIMTTRPTMRNVHGLAVTAQHMQEWLAAHAGEYSREFCEAYAWRTSDTREVAARYLREIDEADVAAYRKGLSVEELAAFDLHVLGLWRSMGHVYDEYETSHAYRIGHALIAIPQKIRKLVELPQAKPGE